jgi:hypothetical protein
VQRLLQAFLPLLLLLLLLLLLVMTVLLWAVLQAKSSHNKHLGLWNRNGWSSWSRSPFAVRP